MNSDAPKTPREELESKLTALLLGELPSEQAFLLREIIERDPDLANVYDRLKKTIELVRETETPPAIEPASEPVRLSDERREKLLQHFKTVKPKEFVQPRRKRFTLLELAAVLVILGLLGALLLPALSKAKSKAQVMSVSSRRYASEAAEPAADFVKAASKGEANKHSGTPWSTRALESEPSATTTVAINRSGESDPSKPSAIALPQVLEVEPQVTLRGAGTVQADDRAFTFSPAPPAEPAKKSASSSVSEGNAARVTLPGITDADGDGSKRTSDWFARNPAGGTGGGSPQSAAVAGTELLGRKQSERLLQDQITWNGNATQPTRGGIAQGFFFDNGVQRQEAEDLKKLSRLGEMNNFAGKPAQTTSAYRTPSIGGQGGGAGQETVPQQSVAGPASTVADLPLLGNTFAKSATHAGGEKPPAPRGFALIGPSGAAPSEALQNGGSNVSDLNVLGYANVILQTNGASYDPSTKAPIVFTNGSTDLAQALSTRSSYARPGTEREKLRKKLDSFHLEDFSSEGLPLNEVVKQLNEKTKKIDPERRGINFIIEPKVHAGVVAGPSVVDPSTGLPASGAISAVDPATGLLIPAEPIDINGTLVKTNLAGKNVRLTDALDAIVKSADQPLTYAINDYGVVLSLKEDSKQQTGSIEQKIEEERKPDPEQKTPIKTSTPPPVPQPEVPTRENAFSTFSLNVSDVSFKLAAASLEKGQLPDAGSIRSEEFINAFDYRDPEPPVGVPIAFAWERARYPFVQNRDLLRFSVKTAAQGRPAGRPLNIVLLLDNSGSMERADRVRIIHEALRVLATQLQPQDKLSVVTFARTARLWVDGVPGNQAARVAEDLSGLSPEGGTNLEEAMNLAYETARRHYLANGINRVVLLTDGAANLGNVEPETLKQKVEAQRKQGFALDCFGIGWEGYNDDLLEVLSRNGDGRYGFINSPEEAATEFAGQLAGALQVAASDVKVQVEFNPNRVTAYRQIGYAKHQLTKEQFRDNTVDAAEIGAAESGNALYTIEINPAGSGPLATVRVRYKVPGTSDYREHEWAVPYTGNALALEQASTAMRLAASAGAFSEWLASNPYAAEVTADRLLPYLSGVPNVYGADVRPQKLEWMIRQAKSLTGK